MTLFLSNLRQRIQEWWSPEEMLVDHWKRVMKPETKTETIRAWSACRDPQHGDLPRPRFEVIRGRKSA